jgi:zinc protease
VASGIRTDVTAPAVTEIFKEVAKIVDTPVTSEELTMVRGAIARSIPSDFETSARTANSLSALFVYGLPLDYYGTLAEQALAVTVKDVQDVARRYLAPDKMLVVAVGDRSRVGPELEKIRPGSVELRDGEGALLQGVTGK